MTEPTVAFLRAVNVGGHNKVPQRVLAEHLEGHLGTPVRHLLQSGNIVAAATDPRTFASVVAGAIRAQAGLEIAVVARSLDQLTALLAANPWPREDPTRVHLSLWDAETSEGDRAAIASAEWGGDQIHFVRGGAWLRFATASHEAKLGNLVLERRLGVTATARNARTIAAVAELAASLPGSS